MIFFSGWPWNCEDWLNPDLQLPSAPSHDIAESLALGNVKFNPLIARQSREMLP